MEKDILNRLRNGESLDDITKSITEELNKANKLFEEEKKAKQEAAEKKAKKVNSLDGILNELYDWFDKWYPGVVDERLTAEKILGLWDDVETYYKKITDNGKTKRTTVSKNGKTSTKEEPSSLFDFMERFF